MKNRIKIHRFSKRFLIAGCSAVALMLVSSALLYIGAGRMFDYYTATDLSEKLLALVRPAAVTVCLGSLGIERYFSSES